MVNPVLIPSRRRTICVKSEAAALNVALIRKRERERGRERTDSVRAVDISAVRKGGGDRTY